MAHTREDFQADIMDIEAEEKTSAALVPSKQKNTASQFDTKLTGYIAVSLLLHSNDKLRSMDIPSAIWLNHILPFLNLESDLKTSLVFTRVKPLSFLFREHLDDVRLTQLHQQIEYGDKTQVKNILEQAKAVSLDKLFNMLSRRGPIVKDYAGYEKQLSAWQRARWNKDVFVTFKNGVYQPDAKGEEMLEMLTRYLKMCAGGEAEIKRQRNELFPAGCAEALEKEIAEGDKIVTELFEALHLAQAIDEDGIVDECQAAFNKLKDFLKPKGVITTGEDINSTMLIKAYELYDAYYERLGNNWDAPRNLIAWQKVVGFIQRYLTACDAMVLAQGAYYIVQYGERLKRTLAYLHGGGVHFPLDLDPVWVLGKNYAGGRLGGGGGGAWGGRHGFGMAWKSYVEQKQRHCESLCNIPRRTARTVDVS